MGSRVCRESASKEQNGSIERGAYGPDGGSCRFPIPDSRFRKCRRPKVPIAGAAALLPLDNHLDPPVAGAALGAGVVGERLGFAQTRHLEAGSIGTECNQGVAH